jgi:hypothetical protein
MFWKILAIGFALILPIHGQQKGGASPSDKAHATKPTNALSPYDPSTVNVINQQTSNQNSDSTSEHPKSYLARLLSPENLPNVLLFVPAVIGIVVAVCTLRKVSNQAELMKRQAKIMERQETLARIAYESSIVLEEWKTTLLKANPLDRLSIQVKLTNPTAFRVTVTEIVFNAGAKGYTSSNRVFIPANGCCVINIVFYADDATMERFNENDLLYRSEGSFTHFGPLGEKASIRQPFAGMLQCGKDRTQMHYEIHMNPEPVQPEHPENQQPN